MRTSVTATAFHLPVARARASASERDRPVPSVGEQRGRLEIVSPGRLKLGGGVFTTSGAVVTDRMSAVLTKAAKKKLPEPLSFLTSADSTGSLNAPPAVLKPNFDPARVQQVKLLALTNSVYGGGIVRAILPVAGTTFTQTDRFGYADRNAYCSAPATFSPKRLGMATFVYVATNHELSGSTARIEGWTARNLNEADPAVEAACDATQP